LSEGLRAQCHLATQLRSAVEQLRLESAAEEVGLATRGRG
jgi:hypothetical protein